MLLLFVSIFISFLLLSRSSLRAGSNVRVWNKSAIFFDLILLLIRPEPTQFLVVRLGGRRETSKEPFSLHIACSLITGWRHSNQMVILSESHEMQRFHTFSVITLILHIFCDYVAACHRSRCHHSGSAFWHFEESCHGWWRPEPPEPRHLSDFEWTSWCDMAYACLCNDVICISWLKNIDAHILDHPGNQ